MSLYPRINYKMIHAQKTRFFSSKNRDHFNPFLQVGHPVAPIKKNDHFAKDEGVYFGILQ